jgi:hypothetical protein
MFNRKATAASASCHAMSKAWPGSFAFARIDSRTIVSPKVLAVSATDMPKPRSSFVRSRITQLWNACPSSCASVITSDVLPV